tara:strand:- start:38 stop:484 length:447 start_codon:yes stop_codon:yes gene_type:complete
MSEADTQTVETKKSKMVPVPGREQAEEKYKETYPEGTWKWLDDPDYKPLSKQTKSEIHQKRAAAYIDDPDGFSRTLGKHSDECIKSIERYKEKYPDGAANSEVRGGQGKKKSAAADTPGPGPAAPDSSAVEEPGAGPQSKQMKNPFLV